MSNDKVVITCALTGVLTNPARHPVPVTPEQMAESAHGAFQAGATVMHCHFRVQEPGLGYLPSWDPGVADAVVGAIRARCPGVIINMSTGTVGPDISRQIACLERVRPEMAALNAGSLNYLKLRADGTWAWPPMLFDNPVEKIQAFIDAMSRTGTVPECECFDTGILRSVVLFEKAGMLEAPIHVSLVMGVASGMPAHPAWLPLLLQEMSSSMAWQVIAIGREEVWALHRRAAELGGHLRTGLEDTFYLPSGRKASSNAELVEALVSVARDAGRDIATVGEARDILGIPGRGPT